MVIIQNPRRFPEAVAADLRRWLEELLVELSPHAGELTVRFIDDEEMRRLNLEFRRRHGTTDVLSFPGDPDEAFLGDIAISVPVARRQAAVAGHLPQHELRMLILHGVLHCLGYDHHEDDGTMERLERQLQKRWLSDER